MDGVMGSGFTKGPSSTTQQTRHLPVDIWQSLCRRRLARRSAMFRPCSSFLFHVSISYGTKQGHSSTVVFCQLKQSYQLDQHMRTYNRCFYYF